MGDVPDQPPPLTPEDYRNAPSGHGGPLAHEWQDKPHRVLYDLVATVEAQATRIEELERLVVALEAEIDTTAFITEGMEEDADGPYPLAASSPGTEIPEMTT